MERPSQLERLFAALDNRYFGGRLHRAGWRVSYAEFEDPLGHGYCDPRKKKILVNFRRTVQSPSLAWILVHEACHAITGDMTHGPAWEAEMRRVEALGSPFPHAHLVEFIRRDPTRPRIRRVARPPSAPKGANGSLPKRDEVQPPSIKGSVLKLR
jgi:hypothetical protein